MISSPGLSGEFVSVTVLGASCTASAMQQHSSTSISVILEFGGDCSNTGPSSPPSSGGGGESVNRALVGGIVGGVVGLAVLTVIVVFVLYKTKKAPYLFKARSTDDGDYII